MSGAVGAPAALPCSVSEGKMDRLILNCDGVGLGTHELARDIVMIARAPSHQIAI
jgi:hypothetical protein